MDYSAGLDGSPEETAVCVVAVMSREAERTHQARAGRGAHQADVSRRMTVPGIGPLTALASRPRANWR